MNKVFKINNKSGFTISELVIAIGLVSIVLAMTIATQMQIDQEIKKIDNSLLDKIDSLSGEKILLFDFQQANLSFNNSVVLDNSGKNFFDLTPESSMNTNLLLPDRTLTLSLTGPVSKSEIVIILEDPKAGATLIYDPIEAYDVGLAPNNFNIAATLTYNSVNKNDSIKNQRPNMWSKGQLLFFDTTSKLRPSTLSSTTLLDMSIPPRSSIFLGEVNAAGTDVVPVALLAPYLNLTHPETGNTISDADTFLRTVSAIGGGVPTIRVRAVKVYRYYLVENNGNIQFFRSQYLTSANNWGAPFLVADKIESVNFVRQSVSSKIINFKINHP